MEDQNTNHVIDENLINRAMVLGEQIVEEFPDVKSLIAIHGIMLTRVLAGLRLSGAPVEMLDDILAVIREDTESSVVAFQNHEAMN